MLCTNILKFCIIRTCENSERKCGNRILHFRRYSRKSEIPLKSTLTSAEDNDSDKFGTLSKQINRYESVKLDEKEKLEEKKMEEKLSREYDHDKKCTKKIKQLLKERKISEALSILDNGDISKPDGYTYGLLIRACGNVGYTKKAFQLYNQMKKRGIKTRQSVYTSLFNACSNSPWKEDGLSRASHLLSSLEDIGYEPNDINYNAMIKAFGRGGDISRAFCLVDQMIDRGIKIDSSTFAFLLQACISDKEAGFRHAVIMWDKMLKNGIQPTVYTYNLLIRCCKECGCGEGIDLQQLSSSNSVLQLPGKNVQQLFAKKKDILTLPLNTKENNPEFSAKFDSGERIELQVSRPQGNNLHALEERSEERKSDDSETKYSEDLNYNQIMINIVGNTVKPMTPQDRLHCIGGSEGLLKQMALKGVKPDIKTFTQLLDVIPSTESAEKELVLGLKQSGVKEDIDFYNMLMKKKMARFDGEGGKSVLTMISTAGLNPNVMTFGILSLGCTNKEEVKTFIAEVKDSGFRLNAETIGGLISGACYRYDVHLVLELMELCIKDEIRPNAHLLQHLDEFKVRMGKAINEVENTVYTHNRKMRFSKKAYEIYKMRLAAWLKEVDLSEAEDIHPWEQFRRHQKKEENQVSEISQ